MSQFTLLLILLASSITLAAAPIQSETPRDRPNILLLCIDDLRPELNCFGVDYIQSPNIDRLAAAGRPFFNHYVAGSRQTVRTATHRLIRHRRKGNPTFLELYDHRSDAGETSNIATEHPDLTRQLIEQLDARLKH